jgi:hypothetical protein
LFSEAVEREGVWCDGGIASSSLTSTLDGVSGQLCSPKFLPARRGSCTHIKDTVRTSRRRDKSLDPVRNRTPILCQPVPNRVPIPTGFSRVAAKMDIASIIGVTRIGELGTTFAVTSNRRTLRRNTMCKKGIRRNVGSYKNHTASHPRRRYSS